METALATTLSASIERTAEAVTPESFETIVRQHQKKVHRYVLLMVKDEDAADTITQECFLRAYQSMVSFRGECRMDTWLLRIAVNLVRDHVKSRRISFWRRLVGFGSDDAPEFQVRSQQPSPEQTLLVQSELQAVWEGLSCLSRQQREIFLLRFVEELSLLEIAGVLGLKVGTVKAQLFRALANIRKQLKEKRWK
ncbi:MAG TPA: RNA polymerase sigma factor [Terriglobales bacterium]|nr:RNA polymerase sigma factor [Terriglobales bacterium]